MKFGAVNDAGGLDLTLPPDHPGTDRVLQRATKNRSFKVYVGCSSWSKQKLKGFYPRGTKDELPYYSSQFNSIEMNATFYRIFPVAQYGQWYEKVPGDFRFFPKVVQNVSHLRRLNDQAYPQLEAFLNATANFGDKLGRIFLQVPDNFTPAYADRVERLINFWPRELPMALEVRHADWFIKGSPGAGIFDSFEQHGVSAILTDTPGRRDVLHMRLTKPEAFVRFVATNGPMDKMRLDEWVARLARWREKGLEQVAFFIHQNFDKETPLLGAYFIERLNKELDMEMRVPMKAGNPTLFS